MTVFVIRRLMQAALVVLIMSLLVFGGVFLVGDPVEMLVADDADQAEREMMIKSMGLDLPFYMQYLRFIGHALQGDMGNSFVFQESAMHLIAERMPATFELAFAALFIAVVLGIPLGIYAGLNANSWISKTIMTSSILGFSLPTFWVGIMMILFFAVIMGWLPSTGRGETVEVFGISVSFLTLDGLQHLILPAVNLALFKLSMVIRLARAGTRVSLPEVRMGLTPSDGATQRLPRLTTQTIMIPVVTVLGLEFGGLVAFSVVTESVFAWPGMGKLLIDSINFLDRPVIVAYLMFVVVLFVFINLIVDVLYSVLDPRVRLQEMKS